MEGDGAWVAGEVLGGVGLVLRACAACDHFLILLPCGHGVFAFRRSLGRLRGGGRFAFLARDVPLVLAALRAWGFALQPEDH